MKRSILLALAAALGATGAAAQMQGRPTPSSPPEQRPDTMSQSGMGQGNRDHGGPGRGLPDQNNHGNNGGMGGSNMGGSMGGMDDHRPMHHDMMPPHHWKKGKMAWSAHARRCAARYRSYNPRTDMYVVRMGMKRRCML